ncbi:hypothetical protein MBLNU459_g1003t3 [Dothideomycetes sp. NU459]
MKTTVRPGTSGPGHHAVDRRDIAHLHQRLNPSFDRSPTVPEPAMSSGGGLQIWPRVSNLPSRELREQHHQHRPHPHQNRSASNSVTTSESGTLRSFYDPSKAPLAVSQQTSASAVRDMALRKGKPVIHVSSSQPDFHAPPRTSRTSRTSREHRSSTEPAELVTTADSPKSLRSQRLDLSRFFGKHKSSRSSSASSRRRIESRISDRTQNDGDVHRTLVADRPAPPVSSGASQRSQNTAFDRDVTENAKVNVRRPPKGIQHWFEGLDESDDDLPEVVQTPSPATFRPSLGPSRSRGAPTSRISPSYHVAPDYFHFGDHPAHASGSLDVATSQANGAVDDGEEPSLQNQSMLNLSSSDDEDSSEPPSPACWPEQSQGINNGPAALASPLPSPYESKLNDMRSSVFTMQTMMTSGSIPIINGDLFRGPLPAMPATYAFPPTPSPSLPTPPHLQRMYSGSSPTRSRPPTVQSIPEVTTTEPAHTMKVTQEEMALLAMMRRKRVEMQSSMGNSPRRSDQGNISRQNALDRLNNARSISSPPMSPSIDMMLDSHGGISFPAPPSISDRRPSARLTRSASAERLRGHKYTSSSSSRLKDKRLPDAPTPHSDGLCELEAEPVEHLAPVCYSAPTPTLPLRRSRSSQVLTTSSSAYNADDPYQLAPDLDFSPLDLLPLPHRMYSPSLATSRSSMVGSNFSAATPERASEADADADVVFLEDGDETVDAEAVAEAEARKGSVKSLSSVGIDVLAAWGALGGV